MKTKLVLIYNEFADFTFKTNKNVKEEDFLDGIDTLNDETINFLIEKFNLDSDCYTDIKESPADIIVRDFDDLIEY